MPVKLARGSIDIGLVVTDIAKSMAFYSDTLGLERGRELPLGRGSVLHEIRIGQSVLKLIQHATPPPAVAPPGGISGATGYRYLTISVDNIEEVVEECKAAGSAVVVPVRRFAPGVTIAIVADPDGNWVELLKTD